MRAPFAPHPLGRYMLQRRLDVGGMGTVYVAQAGTAPPVALKVIHPSIANDPKFVQMFQHEAAVASAIDHPHVCRVLDFGEASGTWFLVMELLEGRSLAAFLRESPAARLSPRVVARIAADAAWGLHAAHTLQSHDGQAIPIVHRDVTPQNVFVQYDGTTKVVDFGIARVADTLSQFTLAGELRGKPAYCAPEQIVGERPQSSFDVWSLGVVLWEATVGQRLFQRDDDVATMAAIVHEPVPRPSNVLPNYPPALEAVVMRALEHAPADRYLSAGELALALEGFLARGAPGDAHAEVSAAMHLCFSADVARIQKARRNPGRSARQVPANATSLAPPGVPSSSHAVPQRHSWVHAARLGSSVILAGLVTLAVLHHTVHSSAVFAVPPPVEVDAPLEVHFSPRLFQTSLASVSAAEALPEAPEALPQVHETEAHARHPATPTQGTEPVAASPAVSAPGVLGIGNNRTPARVYW